MTLHLPEFLAGALALALTACVQPALAPPASAPGPETAAAPAKPRAPRMNGRGKVSSISLTDGFALQQSGQAVIYDARPAFFYQLGHIPGAINLPKANAEARIAALEPEIKAALTAGKTIIVYCTNFACPDARTVARYLAGSGHPSSTLSGGWDAWKESGLPTE